MKTPPTLGRTLSVIVLPAMGIAAIGPVGVAVAQDRAPDNDYWWPDRLSLEPLRRTSPGSSPLGADFDYREAFERVDLAALKADLDAVMTLDRFDLLD